MELRTLRYFLAVAKEKNITKAAELLHMTQPTLSRQLMSLEEEFGVPLFIRSHRNMELSEAGLILKRRAEQIIQLADLALKEVTSSRRSLTGEIWIGCGITQAAETMGKWVSEFQKEYPEVIFHIQNGNSENIMEKISHGLLDVGVVLDPENIDQYDFVRLNEKERWGFLMRTDDPLSQKEYVEIADLENVSVISSPRLTIQNDIDQWCGKRNSFHVLATSELSATGATLVKNHMGLALVTEGAVMDLNPNVYCFRPLKPALYSRSFIVWKKYQTASEAFSRFLEFLHEKINQL